MTDMIQKLAADTPALLLEGARVSRKLASDNVELMEQNAAYERDLTVHKLAIRMHERNLEPDLTITEKIAMLGNMEPKKLAGVEAAIEMSAGGFKLATIRVEEENTSPRPETSKVSTGELGSSANYESLDQRILAL